ncbi:hypothetical protein PF008_g11166 [Phytophthora fragariae]|uniref:Uncharacterized protein n=1 Tax=Phytophthora fragariae TaxID=53985 RepID=A0A6G0RS50_9STRA|nr:hypothetical protein PF008_g11166 [Phytophthora fragariae]
MQHVGALYAGPQLEDLKSSWFTLQPGHISLDVLPVLS